MISCHNTRPPCDSGTDVSESLYANYNHSKDSRSSKTTTITSESGTNPSTFDNGYSSLSSYEESIVEELLVDDDKIQNEPNYSDLSIPHSSSDQQKNNQCMQNTDLISSFSSSHPPFPNTPHVILLNDTDSYSYRPCKRKLFTEVKKAPKKSSQSFTFEKQAIPSPSNSSLPSPSSLLSKALSDEEKYTSPLEKALAKRRRAQIMRRQSIDNVDNNWIGIPLESYEHVAAVQPLNSRHHGSGVESHKLPVQVGEGLCLVDKVWNSFGMIVDNDRSEKCKVRCRENNIMNV